MTDLTAERIKELRDVFSADGWAPLGKKMMEKEFLALLTLAERHLPDALSLEGGETFTRFELIDHTGAEPRGRVFVRYADLVIEQSIQDEGRTLKIFLRSAS